MPLKNLVWIVIGVVEATLVASFCVWAFSSDYFVRMPASVRHGSSVTALVAARALWLLVVLGVFDLAALAWLRGFRPVPFAAGVLLFLIACWLLGLFVVFGFPQY